MFPLNIQVLKSILLSQLENEVCPALDSTMRMRTRTDVASEPESDRGSTSKDNGPKGNPVGKQVIRIQSTPKISRDDVGNTN